MVDTTTHDLNKDIEFVVRRRSEFFIDSWEFGENSFNHVQKWLAILTIYIRLKSAAIKCSLQKYVSNQRYFLTGTDPFAVRYGIDPEVTKLYGDNGR